MIGELGAQRPDLQDEAAVLRRAPRHFDQPVGRERLLHEVVGAEPHGIHRHGDVAMAGDQDHGEILVDRSRLREKSQAVHTRELDVAHDDCRHVGNDAHERGLGVSERLDLEIRKLQRLLGAEQHRRVVFDQQDPDRI